MGKKQLIRQKNGQNLHNELRGIFKKNIDGDLQWILGTTWAGYVVGSYAAMKLTSWVAMCLMCWLGILQRLLGLGGSAAAQLSL